LAKGQSADRRASLSDVEEVLSKALAPFHRFRSESYAAELLKSRNAAVSERCDRFDLRA
jgi:hypothetical protein